MANLPVLLLEVCTHNEFYFRGNIKGEYNLEVVLFNNNGIMCEGGQAAITEADFTFLTNAPRFHNNGLGLETNILLWAASAYADFQTANKEGF